MEKRKKIGPLLYASARFLFLLYKENSMLCMEFIQLIAMNRSSSDVV